MKSKQLKRRQLTMAMLVLALAAAVYLNWRFADGNMKGLIAVSSSEGGLSEADEIKNYGDAEFVAKVADEVEENEYFDKARLNRTQSRDSAIDLLQKSLGQTELTLEAREALSEQLREITDGIKLESDIESIILAKGFRDCVVFINKGAAKVVVASKTGELSESDVSKITEAVVSTAGIAVKDVSIVEVK